MKYSVFLILIFVSCAHKQDATIVVAISANAEWRVVKSVYPNENFQSSPWGEYFETEIENRKVLFFHEGWGKVAAAGATQYAIDRWKPSIIINLGTCGGFQGSVQRYETLLVNRTIIYDIKEAMGDSKQAIDDYSTTIDLSWMPLPDTIKTTLLVSADRDIVPEEISQLKEKYNAIAGDWETGAIAYVCKRNNIRLLALRGVSDLVSADGGEAYGNEQIFQNGTEVVMKKMLRSLPEWVRQVR